MFENTNIKANYLNKVKLIEWVLLFLPYVSLNSCSSLLYDLPFLTA